MTYRDNVKAIIETNFIGLSEEYIEGVCAKICEIQPTEKSYEDGLNDAWECARKIGDNSQFTLEKMGFEIQDPYKNASWDVVCEYSAFEAIAKIKEYEEKQKQCDELNIGDEVIITLNNALYKGEKGVVTQVETQVDGYVRVMFSDGYENSYKVEAIEKTDKSYPEFVNILEQLKEDKE